MRYHIMLLLLHLCLISNAQDYTNDHKGFCGTDTKDVFIEDIKSHTMAIHHYAKSEMRSVGSDYPVTVHIIRKSDGSEGVNVDSFLMALEGMNQQIAPSGVSLKICGEINFIDSDQYYDFYKPDENNLYYSSRVPNTMNLYISNSLTYASGAVRCGYAYFPGWKDMVLIDRHCLLDGSTFTHEVGHYFGLFHTHGNEISDTEELNDQSNCMITGDDVCDTPADPLLTWTVDTATCLYTGDEVDANGDPYVPDPSNMMSYAPKPCKTTLTEGQFDRMAYVAAFLRDYMTCEPFTAEFELDEEVGICGESHIVAANYIGTAEDIDLEWDIDADGSIDASGPFTEFTFSSPGRHDICLMAISDGDTVRQCRTYAVLGSASGAHSVEVDNFADCALINDDKDHGWQVLDLDPTNPDVLMMDNFHYNSPGAEDYIVICPIDLAGLSQPVLQFELAYAPFSAQRADAFRVEISTDCGESFEEIFFGSGLDISSTGDYANDQWQPFLAEDWQLYQLNLAEFLDETVVIRLTNIAGHGNYIYLKQISVTDVEPLPVRFLSIEVNDLEQLHQVVWETSNESGVSNYSIEFSHDGLNFSTICHVTPKKESVNTYAHIVRAIRSDSYYRIKATFEDGSYEFSPIRFMRSEVSTELSLYPNPAYNDIRIDGLNHINATNYQIYNASGKLIRSSVVSGEMIDISGFPDGLYCFTAGGQSYRFIKATR